MFQEMNAIDAFGTRVSIRVLRYLYGNLHRAVGSTEMANALGTTRASVLRRVEELEGLGLVRGVDAGRGRVFRIDSSSPLARPVFELYNHEALLSVRPRTREVLERVMAGIDRRDLVCAVLFGSQARGLAREDSDIDLCFVLDGSGHSDDLGPRVRELAFPYVLVEPHCYAEQEFRGVPDLLVLDALLNGISLCGHGFLFERRCSLESIRREVLLARLEGCRETLRRAEAAIGEARRQFEAMVEVALAEVDSVLHEGVTVPRAEVVEVGDHAARVDRLSEELSRAGDRIWLT